MKKLKQKYDVYYVGIGSGVYAPNYCRQYVGSTFAVSPAQACNNVRYSLRDRKYPNGGYATDVLGDIYDEGEVKFHYEAQLSEEF